MQSHYKEISFSKCEFSCGFAFCEARQTFVFNSSDSKVIENKTELEQSEGNESAGVCVSMLGGLGAVVFFFCFFPNIRGLQTVHLEDLRKETFITHTVSSYSTPVCSRDKNKLFLFIRCSYVCLSFCLSSLILRQCMFKDPPIH